MNQKVRRQKVRFKIFASDHQNQIYGFTGEEFSNELDAFISTEGSNDQIAGSGNSQVIIGYVSICDHCDEFPHECKCEACDCAAYIKHKLHYGELDWDDLESAYKS